MLSAQFGSLGSILCLGAHPDDIEIGCGGTVLRLLDQHPGLRVHWIVMSGAGTVREGEARTAAEMLLADCSERLIEVESFRDSYFPADYEQIKNWFHGLARRCRPDLVLTHRRDDAHQDHRVLAELTWCTFRNHVVLEYEIPKYEGDLGTPNVFVPLEKPLRQRKLDALLTGFASQHEKPWFSRSTFDAVMRLRGIECCSPSGYAEGLYSRKLTL